MVIEDGKIGLDPQFVWLDLRAFDRDVDALQPLLRMPGLEHGVAEIGERLLARYRSPLLDHEDRSAGCSAHASARGRASCARSRRPAAT
ncbi:MAG: hypothetical protein ACREYD_11810, partial [Casimicrobiaceae bacterium]